MASRSLGSVGRSGRNCAADRSALATRVRRFSLLPTLAVLFSFVMLLAVLAEPVLPIRPHLAERRAALGDVVGRRLALMQTVDERRMGLVSVLALGVTGF